MLINYDYVPIKHNFCLEAFHRVKNCLTLVKAKMGAKKINEQGGVDQLEKENIWDNSSERNIKPKEKDTQKEGDKLHESSLKDSHVVISA